MKNVHAKAVAVLFCLVTAFYSLAQSEAYETAQNSAEEKDSASSASELDNLRVKLRELKKFPIVRYAQFDGRFNSSLNVNEKLKGSLVEVSRVFACPRHKGHVYDGNGVCSYISDLRHGRGNAADTCDARTKWHEWREYCSMIPESEARQVQIAEIESRIKTLEEAAKEAARARFLSKSQTSQEAAPAEPAAPAPAAPEATPERPPVAQIQPRVADTRKVVVERDGEILVRLQVPTIIRVLNGEEISSGRFRVYKQED